MNTCQSCGVLTEAVEICGKCAQDVKWVHGPLTLDGREAVVPLPDKPIGVRWREDLHFAPTRDLVDSVYQSIARGLAVPSWLGRPEKRITVGMHTEEERGTIKIDASYHCWPPGQIEVVLERHDGRRSVTVYGLDNHTAHPPDPAGEWRIRVAGYNTNPRPAMFTTNFVEVPDS